MKMRLIVIFAVLLIFFVLNIPLLKEQGYSPDISTLQNWGNIALDHGLSSLITETGANYPLYLYVLEFNSFLQKKMFGNNNPLDFHYNIIHKTIPLISNLLIGLVIFLYFRKKGIRTSLFAATLYLLNLAVIYTTAYWGQLDAFVAWLNLLCIVFLIKKRYVLSTVFLTFSILTKLLSVFLLPVLAIVIIMNANFKEYLKIILSNTFVILLLSLPFIFGGAFYAVLKVLFHFASKTDFVTVNAYNLWRLLQEKFIFLGGMDDVVFLGITIQEIGLIFFAIYALLVMYQIFKNNNQYSTLLAVSSLIFAFFMLPTRIHERYFFYFFAFGAMIAVMNWRYLVMYIILMFTHLFNLMMVLHYGGPHYSIFYPIQLFLDWLIKLSSFNSVATTIALINVVAFVYFSWTGIFKGLSRNIKEDLTRLKPRLCQLTRDLCRRNPF